MRIYRIIYRSPKEMITQSTKSYLLGNLLQTRNKWICNSCLTKLTSSNTRTHPLRGYHPTRSITSQPQHHNLSSFLEYASRTGLPKSSTTYVGTKYEYIALYALSRLGFALVRTGGRDDAGVDLVGAWLLPPQRLAQTSMNFEDLKEEILDRQITENLTSQIKDGELTSVKALIQCKALAKKPGPNHIRELEGAFAAASRLFSSGSIPMPTISQDSNSAESESKPTDRLVEDANSDDTFDESRYGTSTSTIKPHNTLALLVTRHTATKGVRDALGRSRLPMGYLKLTLEGRIEQILWNRAAKDCGLMGLRVETRFLPETASAASTIEAVSVSDVETRNETEVDEPGKGTGEEKQLAAEAILLWGEKEWAWSEEEVRKRVHRV